MAKAGKVKILPRNHKVRKIRGYDNEMGILTDKNDLAFPLVACKEEFYMAVSKHLGWKNIKLDDKVSKILPGKQMEKGKTIYTKSARLVMICREERKATAHRVLDVVERLRKRLKLHRATTVYYARLNSSPALLIDCDKFFLKSPVAQSAIMTFIRSAMCSTFKYKSLNDFIDKMIKYGYDYDEDEVDLVFGTGLDDADQLSDSKNTGVLDKFLSRKLVCLNRKGFTDCRFYRDEYGEFGRPDGIADHMPGEYLAVTKKDAEDKYEEIYPSDLVVASAENAWDEGVW